MQGQALRLVVIDKIPFPQPTPVEIARQAGYGREAFMRLQVPEAMLKLKQGFGRLIRSRNDFGVVAMLDPRLWLKGYGHKIVNALPDALVVRSIGEVAQFYDELEGPMQPVATAVVPVEDDDPLEMALAEAVATAQPSAESLAAQARRNNAPPPDNKPHTHGSRMYK